MPRKPPAPKLTVVAPLPARGHPAPPGKLNVTGMGLWRAVTENYEFADPASTQILFQACASADRAEACRVIIDRDGEIVKTRNGPGANPLMRDELANRALCARLLSKLVWIWSRSAPGLAGRLGAENADQAAPTCTPPGSQADAGGGRGVESGRLLAPARRAPRADLADAGLRFRPAVG
jgi:hypothetical protein